MSNQQFLKQFFASKVFNIPKYQRSYAWEKQNIWDLFHDIQEALDTKSNHYIGTVVLAKTDREDIFNIVDGQQRITTLVMFIGVIIRKLEAKEDQDFYRRYYVKEKEQFKLTPLERDKLFYFQILDGTLTLKPESKSQKFMSDAYEEMETIVNNHIKDPLQFLKAIEALSILEFIEKSESDAIRIFQTVNDRGRGLSRMDKMKSLLFYFSNKYLSEKYDDAINDKFGEIFELYDDIKSIGEDQKINIVNSKLFTEDDLLRHHHICFSEESYDPTGQQVLDNVKSKLYQCRKDNDFIFLDKYISKYLDSLLEYVRAFKRIISRTIENEDYYKLFAVLGLSAVYYPVITQLEKNLILNKILPTKGISVLKMVEIIDVRVLKIREYAGKKHIAEFAFNLNNHAWTIQKIEEHLLWFNLHEISNDRFKDYLSNFDYYKQTGLLRTLFIDYCERLRGSTYSIAELRKIMDNDPTIEHILSQNPNFKPRAYGFKNEEDFEEYKNLLGNLTLLEKNINSSIKNYDLVEKLSGYSKSKFKMTSIFATSLSTTRSFKKTDLLNRGQQLVEDFAKRWWA
ncbi:DUF262 domain-containing HNH endonuclease family protein [Nitrosomonas sp.]|uniref:DUF262 domain-containing protein n=1 Tax=Nitrosomonas sp. TaxID=42353 RepID=UPI0025EEA7A7|nr:DUF262 domain-containing HNH endonuclease family protein [Nitrosomonas sp.]